MKYKLDIILGDDYVNIPIAHKGIVFYDIVIFNTTTQEIIQLLSNTDIEIIIALDLIRHDCYPNIKTNLHNLLITLNECGNVKELSSEYSLYVL